MATIRGVNVTGCRRSRFGRVDFLTLLLGFSIRRLHLPYLPPHEHYSLDKMFNALRNASRSAGVLRVARRATPLNAPRVTPFVRTLISTWSPPLAP